MFVVSVRNSLTVYLKTTLPVVVWHPAAPAATGKQEERRREEQAVTAHRYIVNV